METSQDKTPHEHDKPLCGAHARSAGRPCQNIAGYKTDHLGTGRCAFHGGRSPVKSGRYSKTVRELSKRRHAALYQEFREDPGIDSLRDELALLRVLIATCPEVITVRNKSEEFQRLLAIAQLIDGVGRTALRKMQIESTRGRLLTERDVKELGDAIYQSLARNITDQNTITNVINDLITRGLWFTQSPDDPVADAHLPAVPGESA